MIRELMMNDMDDVMKIWLTGNQEAHTYIAKEYWLNEFEHVRNSMQDCELYVYEKQGHIVGFIGVINNYIAGLFVHKKYRGLGYGKELLYYVKQKHLQLSLHVYEKNKPAILFYQALGFVIQDRLLDEATGEWEYQMSWKGGSK